MWNVECKPGQGMTTPWPQAAASLLFLPGSLNPSPALMDTNGINTERDKKIGTTDEEEEGRGTNAFVLLLYGISSVGAVDSR